MNKIFKVIFNKITGLLIVVSELAKNCGKVSSTAQSATPKSNHKAKIALLPLTLLFPLSSLSAATLNDTYIKVGGTAGKHAAAEIDGKNIAIGVGY